MNLYDFTSKFKDGDIIKVGTYILIFAGTQEVYSHIRQGLMNVIMFYAIIDPYDYDTVAVYLRPATGLGYIEDYRDDEVKLVPNKSKKHFFDEIAKRGYKWDSTNNRIVIL